MTDTMNDCECATCDPTCDMVALDDEKTCTECQMGIHRPDRDDD